VVVSPSVTPCSGLVEVSVAVTETPAADSRSGRFYVQNVKPPLASEVCRATQRTSPCGFFRAGKN
jgi:hypothetical protein